MNARYMITYDNVKLFFSRLIEMLNVLDEIRDDGKHATPYMRSGNDWVEVYL